MKYIELVTDEMDLGTLLESNSSPTLVRLFLDVASRSYFAMSVDQLRRLKSATAGSRLLEWGVEEFIRSSTLQVLANSENAIRSAELLEGQTLADYITSEPYTRRTIEYKRGFEIKADIESAASRLFAGHLGFSNKVTLVDPYIVESLIRDGSGSRKVFTDHFLQKDRFVEVHTKLPWLGDRKRPSYSNIQGRDIYLDWQTFGDFAASAVRDLCEEANFLGHLEVHFWRARGFPHDRHVEFSLPSGRGVKTDYFALGNGFDTISDFNGDDKTRPKAQIYDSDQTRMWAWQDEDGSGQPMEEFICKVCLATNETSMTKVSRKLRW